MKATHTGSVAAGFAMLMLAACSGGGGGIVQSSPPPQAPPPEPPPAPPPPPPPAVEPCPMPVTGDCVVEANPGVHTFDEYGMTGGRQSDHRLFVHGGSAGGSWVNLHEGEYSFSGGTEIAGTSLVVWDRLVSDVRILRDDTGMGFIGESELWLMGSVQGDVWNDGRLDLQCSSGIHDCTSVPQQRIDGNFIQTAHGVLVAVLGRHLEITGTAMLDGRLLMAPGAMGYVLPSAPNSLLILSADGGVEGTFDDWSTENLFLEGALRYTANDVFFDATRISLQRAVAAKGIGGRLGQAGAANLDRALATADAFAQAPQESLGEAQQQFLSSASSLMWLRDTAQAARSFDSLAGHAHAAMREVPYRQAALVAAQLDARLARQSYDAGRMRWVGAIQQYSDGFGVSGTTTGVDQWLSPRLLVGGGISSGTTSMRIDHVGGQGRAESPAVDLHLHYRGDGWHATGVLGAGRTWLQLQRTIELGAAGRHVVHSDRNLRHAFLQGEVGRDIPLGVGKLVPFVALGYDVAHGDAFAEQGGTGLELVAGPSRQARLSGAFGVRFARDWLVGRHWLRLELDARHRRDLVDDDPLLAAFRGVPDVHFALPDTRAVDTTGMRLGLVGMSGARTQWSLDYARDLAGGDGGEGWRIGLRRAF